MATIKDLQEQEGEILTKREYHKKEVRVLTKDLYNTRQKIKYAKKTEDKEPCGLLFKMFGKKVHELTVEEKRQYNNALRNIRKKDKNS